MTLPHDIARCATDGCLLAAKCRRKEPGNSTHQWYSLFPGGEDCDAYWPKEDDSE